MGSTARHSDGSTQYWLSSATIDWSGASATPAASWYALMMAMWVNSDDATDASSRYTLSIDDWTSHPGSLAKFRVSGNSYMAFRTVTPGVSEGHFADGIVTGQWHHTGAKWLANGSSPITARSWFDGAGHSLSQDQFDSAQTRLIANKALAVGCLFTFTGGNIFNGAYTDLGIWMGPDDSLFPSDSDMLALAAGTKRPNQVGTGLQTWGQTGGTGLRLYYQLNGSGTSEPEFYGGPALALTGSATGTQVAGPSQLSGASSKKYRLTSGGVLTPVGLRIGGNL